MFWNRFFSNPISPTFVATSIKVVFFIGAILPFISFIVVNTGAIPKSFTDDDYLTTASNAFETLNSFQVTLALGFAIGASGIHVYCKFCLIFFKFMIIILAPVFIDFVLDQISSSKTQWTSYSNLITSLRLLVLLTILVDIFLLIYLIPYNEPYLVFACLIFRDILVTVTILYNMHTLFPTIWSKHVVLIIPFLLMISNNLATLTPKRNEVLNYVGIPLQCVAFLLLFIQYFRWFIFVYNNIHINEMKSRIYLGNLYAFSIFIFLCFDWSVFFVPTEDIPTTWSSFIGENYFTMYTYLIAGTTITLTVVTVRLGRIEIMENQVI
jgi:hypothetical protein